MMVMEEGVVDRATVGMLRTAGEQTLVGTVQEGRVGGVMGSENGNGGQMGELLGLRTWWASGA